MEILRMLNWYDGEHISISFSDRPCIVTRYPMPSMTDDQIKEVKKYPFVNHKDLQVKLIDYYKQKTYTFTIPKGYCWDGATVPRIFWRLVGSKTDSAFLIASMVHDVLCEHHDYVDNDRYFADKVFERLLYVANVNAFTRWLMFHSVDNFQKFCGWEKK